jgi:zinc transport system substrate-binding protein
VGGESDTWVKDALEEAVNPDLVAVNMMEALEDYGNLYEEEHVWDENVSSGNIHSENAHSEKVSSEHERIQGTGHSHDDGDDSEYDEHIWLSLRNAVILNEYICEVLSVEDADNATLYRNNCDKYVSELSSLDSEYMNVVGQSDSATLLFADRFAFRYMVEDYGLNYYAAFEGCSAETEASFNIVAYLADKFSELGLNAVVILDGSSDRLAQVIIENSNNTDGQIVVFNSMQSVSKNDIENGVTYLSAMRDNLSALKLALSLE